MVLVGKGQEPKMKAKRFELGSLSARAFQSAKWALSVAGALAASMVVVLLEAQA